MSVCLACEASAREKYTAPLGLVSDVANAVRKQGAALCQKHRDELAKAVEKEKRKEKR